MTSNSAGSVRTTVRLPSPIQEQIDTLARARGVTSQSLVRCAVEDYLRRSEQVSSPASGSGGTRTASADLTRIALTTEFTQASVDVLLRELAPDKRGEVLLTVEQRMGTYHGQK